MAMKQHPGGTVVGVFSNRESAQKAIRELRTAGFPESDIGMVSAAAEEDAQGATSADDDENYVASGAASGAVAGAGVGALWGLGILAGALPAIGPAIAGGTLAALLSSAAAGAATAGLAGALIGAGIPEEEAEYYEGELNAGRTIVTVRAGNRVTDASELLRRFGGYDVSTRGNTAAASPQTTADTPKSGKVSDVCATGLESGQETIQARKEKLRVQKTPVEAGEVTVRKEVHTEHKTIDVPVTKEEVVVTRHSGSGAQVSTGLLKPGEEIRVPVKEEQVRVEKQVVGAEEVTVEKQRVQDTQRVEADLQREEIKVESQGDVKVRDQRKK